MFIVFFSFFLFRIVRIRRRRKVLVRYISSADEFLVLHFIFGGEGVSTYKTARFYGPAGGHRISRGFDVRGLVFT